MDSRERKNIALKNIPNPDTLTIYNELTKKEGEISVSPEKIPVYEYLAIPTFVRQGKIINAGF